MNRIIGSFDSFVIKNSFTVPPKNLFFQYFGLSEASEIEEVSDTESYSNSIVAQADQPLNISCITPVSKPESQIQWIEFF